MTIVAFKNRAREITEGWILRARFVQDVPWHLFYLASKDELFVSPHTKLCALDKAAFMVSQELAEQFRSALVPVLKKRHGDEIEILVEQLARSKKGSEQTRVDHSEIVQKRLQQKKMAPNAKLD